MPIYLTYDNASLQDGLGAQSLRIMGVFSLAKFFKIRYLHSPIANVIEEFSHGLDSDISEQILLDYVNQFFNFPNSNINSSNELLYIPQRNINLKRLLFLKIKYMFSRKNVIVRILLPFHILDKYPLLYTPSIKYLRRLNRSHLCSKPVVVIHVRWGYGWKYADNRRIRLLPFDYYSEVTDCLIRKFSISKDYTLVVHTDLSNKDTKWIPKQREILQKASSEGNSITGQPIDIEGYDLERLIQFPRDRKVQIHYCSNFVDAFLEMCNAEFLVMGSSAFSYVAALLNPNTVVWPDTHGHARRSQWYASSELGKFIKPQQMLKEGHIGV